MRINKWASETYIFYQIPICDSPKIDPLLQTGDFDLLKQQVQTLCHKDCQKGWQTQTLYTRQNITYSVLI